MFLFTLATFRIFFFILDFQHFCYDMFRDLGEVFTYSFFFNSLQGLPRWLNGKKSACQCRSYRRCRFDLWVWKIHWGRKWHPTPVFLPGKSHGQRSLEGYSPQGCKESEMTEWRSRHAHILWNAWICLISFIKFGKFCKLIWAACDREPQVTVDWNKVEVCFSFIKRVRTVGSLELLWPGSTSRTKLFVLFCFATFLWCLRI